TLDSDIEYVYNEHLETERGLPMTPPFSRRTNIIYKPKWQSKILNNTFISLEGHYFAQQNRTYINEAVTEGYFIMNFSISNTVAINEHKFSINLQCRNLTNAVYMNNMSRYRILNLPEQGRNLQV